MEYHGFDLEQLSEEYCIGNEELMSMVVTAKLKLKYYLLFASGVEQID